MRKYKVIEDLQNTDFALGVVNDIEGWRQQAIEWAEWDENFELVKDLKAMKAKHIIGFIEAVWALKIEEVE